MEKLVSQLHNSDPGHASVVGFELNTDTYIATPVWVGKCAVFPYDLPPEELPLFENFAAAPVAPYVDIETFLDDERPEGDGVGTLNFMAFFQPAETIAGESHKQKNAYKRLRIINPELVARLEHDLASAYSFAELGRESQEMLFQAYNLMAGMIDINDSNVFLLQPDGSYKFDSDFLKR